MIGLSFVGFTHATQTSPVWLAGSTSMLWLSDLLRSLPSARSSQPDRGTSTTLESFFSLGGRFDQPAVEQERVEPKSLLKFPLLK